jgi:hypothetical protein
LIDGDLGVAGRIRLVNDGAGSGLDADLLDGLDSSAFLTTGPWEVSGSNVYLLDASVGIGTETPQSVLQVVGDYIQFPTIYGEPAGEECAEASHYGRVVVNIDSGSEFHLYVCTDGGWVGK